MIRLPPALHGPFRWIAGGTTLFLFYTSLVYLIEPRADEAARVYDYAVLIGFEFILNPLAMLLRIVKGSVAGTLAVAAFFSGFVFSFAILMIDASAMLMIIAALLIGHVLPTFDTRPGREQEEVGRLAGRIVLYFFVLMGCVLLSPLLPKMGLGDAWLETSRYGQIKQHGGLLLDEPHVSVWIGTLYFGVMLFTMLYMRYWEWRHPTPEARAMAEQRAQARMDRWTNRIEAAAAKIQRRRR